VRQKWRIVMKYARLIRALHRRGPHLGNRPVPRAVKFVGRAVLRWPATTRWLEFIESHSLAHAPDAVKKELAEKVHRPYARRGLGAAERAALLIDHYSVLEAALPRDVLAAMVAGNRLPLAYLEGRRDASRRYAIAVSRERLFKQQGELAILFIDELINNSLATLALNIAIDRCGRRVLFISGLQGPPPPTGNAEIKTATRSLDGLRPKHAVLETAYALARWLEVDAIVATSKHNHVSQTGGRRSRRIHADYDGFWTELGGVVQANGDFRLPRTLSHRNVDQVPAKRRKSWLRRHARLDKLDLDVTRALSILARPETEVHVGALQMRARRVARQ
jgi:uncharacterized protein VirK/YbjX